METAKCQKCGKVFSTVQGLGLHRRHAQRNPSLCNHSVASLFKRFNGEDTGGSHLAKQFTRKQIQSVITNLKKLFDFSFWRGTGRTLDDGHVLYVYLCYGIPRIGATTETETATSLVDDLYSALIQMEG